MLNALIPPPVVALLCGAAMWVVDRQMSGRIESAWLLPIAGALLATGVLLLIAAVVSFVAARTTINPLRPSNASNLITTGVFSRSRNPIYLADLLILAAYAVWLGNLLNVVFLAGFVWYIQRFQILPEERALTERFGARYTTYCAHVRRWL